MTTATPNTSTVACSPSIVIEQLKVVSEGPLPSPVVVNDKTRGRVHLLSKPNEDFRAFFEMKAGQLRGCAYHTVGTVTFDILEGSHIFMSANGQLQNGKLTGISIRQVDAPCRIDIPAGVCHVFLPLCDGLIFESVDQPSELFLKSYVKLLKEFAPYVEQLRKEIAGGKYKPAGTLSPK